MPSHLIAPSLLAADLGRLDLACALIDDSAADWLHYDVMDGQFVPNLSLGIPTLKYTRQLTKKPIDVHLMIERPERHIETFREAGADHITVHYETCPNLHRTVQQIKEIRSPRWRRHQSRHRRAPPRRHFGGVGHRARDEC